MPIKKSAMKALRQSTKRSIRNFKIKRQIKDLVKDSKELMGLKDKSAVDKVKQAIKAIDKAVQKKVVQKNSGARKKSRLMKKLNQLVK